MKKILDQTIYKWFNKFISGRHSLLWVYVLVLIFLAMGVTADSGSQYIFYLTVYSGVFILTYFLADKYSQQSSALSNIFSERNIQKGKRSTGVFSLMLFGVTVIFIICHFIYLGGVPTVTAWESHNSFEIYTIRHDVTANASALINYLSSFTLKAIIPFLLIYFYQNGNWKLFIPVFLVSLFYCAAFVAKSFLVTALIPLLIFAFAQKKYLQLILFSILIFGGLNFLVFVSNPSLRGGDTYQGTSEEPSSIATNKLERSVSGLSDRTFFLPGKMVSDWFRAIPEKKPFLKGSGYHFISNLKGTEFRDYSTELYPIVYPDYAKRGYAGTVNVASFMYDYANFGWIGIIYSAIILAIVFVFINLIFGDENRIKFCINIFYVLVLSSSSLLTLLFSGGWALMILLFLFFRIDFKLTSELKAT